MTNRFTMFIVFGFFIALNVSITKAENNPSSGEINGTVIDKDTKMAVVGATVIIAGTERGVAADTCGKFSIKNVVPGEYVLRINCQGYEPISKTDIIVKSGRPATVLVELNVSAISAQTVTVKSGFFSQTQDQPNSSISFSAEEIRRSPGAVGDISRIVASLPAVARLNDQSNSLIVRGGNPSENAFYIDNIEIPNINHFPAQGSSGGALGLLNVDLIRDIMFYTGGFSAIYGDKLSSVMDLSLREGSAEKIKSKIDMSMAGVGLVSDGPISNGKGSWLVSARKSYVDWLSKIMDLGVTPWYGDGQAKLTYDINSRNKILFIDVFGIDHSEPTKEEARDLDFSVYGLEEYVQNTAGLTWRRLWRQNGYSMTSLSYSLIDYRSNFNEAVTDFKVIDNHSYEGSGKFRNLNHLRLNKANYLEFGCDAGYLGYNYDVFYGPYTDAIGDSTPAFYNSNRVNAAKYGLFLSYNSTQFARLKSTIGLRADYFAYNDKYSISPRFSVSYQLSELMEVNGSAGYFSQSAPIVLLSQNSNGKDLDQPIAVHYTFGISRLLTENTRLTLDSYIKKYDKLPIDPSQPSLFVLDEVFYRSNFYFPHESLSDRGTADAKGVEAIIQKKLEKVFYGILGASYSRSRYAGGDGIWRNRAFDNRLIVNIEGGYRPNEKWELSGKWVFAGGAPYTPLNLEKSRAINRAVLDETKINAERCPDYHSLSVRFDRRFNFNRSSLIIYLSVWNAYNRQNVASYFWNQFKNAQDTQYQWGIMPIFGLEYDF